MHLFSLSLVRCWECVCVCVHARACVWDYGLAELQQSRVAHKHIHVVCKQSSKQQVQRKTLIKAQWDRLLSPPLPPPASSSHDRLRIILVNVINSTLFHRGNVLSIQQPLKKDVSFIHLVISEAPSLVWYIVTNKILAKMSMLDEY